MILSVYNISEVMQPRCCQRKVNSMIVCSQRIENIADTIGYNPYMSKAVFGITQRTHRLILLIDVYVDVMVMSYLEK